MQTDFELPYKYTAAYEGGYVNHPRDPGGATNRGITQRTYNAWLRKNGHKTRDVRHITDNEVKSIYYHEYWRAANCNLLPRGVDFVVYDAAVNSGVSRSVRWLQAIVGTAVDGINGSKTQDAVDMYVAAHGPDRLIERLCYTRLDFVQSLDTFDVFGKGWTRRIMGNKAGSQPDDIGVIDRGMAMAANDNSIEPVDTPAPHKTPVGDVIDPVADNTLLGVIIRWLVKIFGEKRNVA